MDVCSVGCADNKKETNSKVEEQKATQKEIEKKNAEKRNEEKRRQEQELSEYMNPVDKADIGNRSHGLGEAIAVSIIGSVIG